MSNSRKSSMNAGIMHFTQPKGYVEHKKLRHLEHNKRIKSDIRMLWARDGPGRYRLILGVDGAHPRLAARVRLVADWQ